jgi:hypothetical protein
MRTDGRTGTSIRPGRLLSALVQILIIAAIVGAITGYAVIPSWRDTVNSIIGSITDVILPAADPVSTAGMASGPSVEGRPAQNAFDGSTAYWAAPFAEASPPTIEAAFIPVADISKVLITAGAPGEVRKTLARPRAVTLQLLSSDGTVILTREYELKDEPAAQSFDVGGKEAATVRLTVRSVYLASDTNAPVAITEIDFFGRLAPSGSAAQP